MAWSGQVRRTQGGQLAWQLLALEPRRNVIDPDSKVFDSENQLPLNRWFRNSTVRRSESAVMSRRLVSSVPKP
jgi:hypothetical protein